MSYEFITAEQKGRVGVITLNRPKQLNALSPGLMKELGQALAAFDADAGVGAILLTGNEKAFAAGADIAAMKDFSYLHAYMTDYITNWEHFRSLRKPVIAAVAGYALGGGCALAMQCDIVIAADNARFGQPEVTLGIMRNADPLLVRGYDLKNKRARLGEQRPAGKDQRREHERRHEQREAERNRAARHVRPQPHRDPYVKRPGRHGSH